MSHLGDIRVLVADSQPLFRDALARIVRQRRDMALVAEAAEGRTALALIRSMEPDVGLVDARLPGLDGAGVLNAVVREQLATRLVLLVSELRPGEAYRAVARGARGVLPKDATSDEVERAVRAVFRGQTAFGPDVQSELAHEIRLRADEQRPVLSRREQEILALIAEGQSAPQIAGRLHVATATVKTHILHVYDKLEVSERAAAVAVAMRRGLLE